MFLCVFIIIYPVLGSASHDYYTLLLEKEKIITNKTVDIAKTSKSKKIISKNTQKKHRDMNNCNEETRQEYFFGENQYKEAVNEIKPYLEDQFLRHKQKFVELSKTLKCIVANDSLEMVWIEWATQIALFFIQSWQFDFQKEKNLVISKDGTLIEFLKASILSSYKNLNTQELFELFTVYKIHLNLSEGYLVFLKHKPLRKLMFEQVEKAIESFIPTDAEFEYKVYKNIFTYKIETSSVVQDNEEENSVECNQEQINIGINGQGEARSVILNDQNAEIIDNNNKAYRKICNLSFNFDCFNLNSINTPFTKILEQAKQHESEINICFELKTTLYIARKIEKKVKADGKIGLNFYEILRKSIAISYNKPSQLINKWNCFYSKYKQPINIFAATDNINNESLEILSNLKNDIKVDSAGETVRNYMRICLDYSFYLNKLLNDHILRFQHTKFHYFRENFSRLIGDPIDAETLKAHLDMLRENQQSAEFNKLSIYNKNLKNDNDLFDNQLKNIQKKDEDNNMTSAQKTLSHNDKKLFKRTSFRVKSTSGFGSKTDSTSTIPKELHNKEQIKTTTDSKNTFTLQNFENMEEQDETKYSNTFDEIPTCTNTLNELKPTENSCKETRLYENDFTEQTFTRHAMRQRFLRKKNTIDSIFEEEYEEDNT